MKISSTPTSRPSAAAVAQAIPSPSATPHTHYAAASAPTYHYAMQSPSPAYHYSRHRGGALGWLIIGAIVTFARWLYGVIRNAFSKPRPVKTLDEFQQ